MRPSFMAPLSKTPTEADARFLGLILWVLILTTLCTGGVCAALIARPISLSIASNE